MSCFYNGSNRKIYTLPISNTCDKQLIATLQKLSEEKQKTGSIRTKCHAVFAWTGKEGKHASICLYRLNERSKF